METSEKIKQIETQEVPKLLLYQKVGVAHVVERLKTQKSFLLADEPGLGKTIQALCIANALNVRRVMVVCPASVIAVWAREEEKWLESPSNGKILTCDILSYESAAKIIQPERCDLLIVDESHYLKTPNAVRTKAVLGRLASLANKVLFLSGTPMPNCPIELQTVFGFIRPDLFGDYWSFAKRYCAAKQKRIPLRSVNGVRQSRLVWDVKGASNLEELRRLGNSVMLRRRKSEVMRELPEKWYSRYDIELDGHEVDKFYDLENMTLSALSQLERDEHLMTARKSLALAKAAPVVELVRTLLDGGTSKLVVFGWHVEALEMIRSALNAKGIFTVGISGNTPVIQRGEIVQRFQEDVNCKVFCGNILAAGTGITLTAASTVIFLERDWTPANNLQAEDRCHRIGQQDNVDVIITHVEDSVDDIVSAVLRRKKVIAEKFEENMKRSKAERSIAESSAAERSLAERSEAQLSLAQRSRAERSKAK